MTRLASKILAMAIGAAVVSPAAAQSDAPVAEPLYMAEGADIRGPRGFYELCARAPEHCPAPVVPVGEVRVAVSAATLSALGELNRQINVSYLPVTDEEAHGVGDLWSPPVDTADCEDFVIAKRAALIAYGWPAEALLIGVTVGESTPYHAVLIVRTTAGELVLDNLRDDIRPWERTGYEWVIRQSKSDPRRWVRITGAETPLGPRLAQAE